MSEQKKTAPPRRSYRDLLYSIHRVLMLAKYGERGWGADEEGLTAIEKLMEENGFSLDQPSAKEHLALSKKKGGIA